MKARYSGSTPGTAEALWEWLCAGDAAIAAIPGASVDRDGSQVKGSLRIKPGTGQITYRISAGAAPAAGERTATIAITGKEARGGGTIAATVSIAVTVADDRDAALVADAEIEVTGRAADAEQEGWDRCVALIGGSVLSAYAVPMPDSADLAEAVAEPIAAPQAAPAPTTPPAPPASAPRHDPTPALNPTPAMPHQAPTATSRPLRGPVIGIALLVAWWLLRRVRRTRG